MTIVIDGTHCFRAFDGQLSTIGQKLASASCLGAIADKIKNIANRLTVSAICEVDIASGLPEYPIHGRIKFTQPVTFLCSCRGLIRQGNVLTT